MRKSLLVIALPTLVLVLVVASLAIAPGILTGLSQGPPSTSVSAPAWNVGDRWTYNVSLTSTGEKEILPVTMMPVATVSNESFVVGTLTETVVSSVSTPSGEAWNVTLDGSFGFESPPAMLSTEPTVQSLSMPAVKTSGFVWLRQSDLAPIYSLKTVHLDRNWTLWDGLSGWYGMLANTTYSLSYDATTQVWYAPPLAIWQFPLEENASWNASSNATIHYASAFRILGPNVTYEADHFANFTIPVDVAMHTGFFENVTTPAGTFRALPAWASHGLRFGEIPDRDASAMMNLTGEMDFEMPRSFATAWFSAQAGNVVRADFGSGLFDRPRVELDLVSYAFS